MGFERLSRYFPPPQFLKPPHVGIYFSDSNIKAISFDRALTEPRLKSIVVPIEKESIVAGSIVNMDEIVKKLRIVRENFSSPFVFFTIPDELTYVFSASVLVGSGSDATESVAFIIEENVPLSLSDVIFDFVPTKIIRSGSEYTASVVVTACAKKEIEKFTEALHKSGFEPIGGIHESQAITKAVVPKNFPGTLSIIHARENRTGIHLVKNGIVHFSTTRSILNEDYKKQFLDEYEKFLEYCLKRNLNQDQPIKSTLVCGEFEFAKKVVEAVIDTANYMGDITLSNVWTNVFDIDKHLPDIPYEKSLSFAGPIGAALSDIM